MAVLGKTTVQPDRPSVGPRGPGGLIEARGIELVPEHERWGSPSRLFGMWAGTCWNVEFVVYGTLAVAIFGLSFAQAVAIILVGNCFYVLTGLASLPGAEAGTTAFGVSRAAFGPRGNRAPSFFNWVTQVGFEIEGIALIVLVAVAMFAKGGVQASTVLKVVLVIAAVAVQALLPLVGHRAMLKVLHWLAYPFIALFVIMAVITAGKVNLHAAPHGAGWGSLMVFLALVISVGGLGWTENASDYSRYLPAATSKKRIVAAVALGAAIPSALLEVLGAAVATAVAPAHAGGLASVTGLVAVFPAWFIWPYFLMALLQLFAINSVDLYSSGVTLQSLWSRLRRWHCVLIDTVVAGGFAAYAVFSGRFSQLLADFILFIIVWLAPWFAIYFIDYLLRGRRYDPAALMDEKGGLYFRRSGVHWPAVVAQAVGMLAAMAWLNAYSPYVSWLSSHVDGSDFSVFMGLVFGGGTYFLLARKGIRQEPAYRPVPAY
ncbi:MAG: cytosine permease [Actinomycetota bacterium]|nr:cytosine permease [Actinomycetota bacterium]